MKQEEAMELWDKVAKYAPSEVRIYEFTKLVAAHERESWPAEMKAMENQVNILTDELGKAVKSEREACAKVLDEMAKESEEEMEPSGYTNYYLKKAAEIRARGNQS